MLVGLSFVAMLPGLLVSDIIDKGFVSQNYNLILKLSLYLAIVYVFKAVFSYVLNISFVSSSQKLIYEIRKDVYTRLFKIPIEFFNDHESGYIMSRIGETNNIGHLFTPQTFKVVISMFELIVFFLYLSSINFKITLIMAIPMPLFFLISYQIMKPFFSVTKETMEKGANFQGKVTETLQGMEEIKNQSLEDSENDKIKDYNQEFMKLSIRQSLIMSFGTEGLQLLNLLVYVLLYIVSGYFYIVDGDLTIGNFFVFNMFIGKLYAPLIHISTSYITIQPAILSLKRIQEFFYHSDIGNESELEDIDNIKSLAVKNLSYTYKGQSNSVFTGLSFKVDTGDTVLIKGANGSGKTTLIKLMLKILRDYDGEIFINGRQLDNINSSSLKKQIGIVSQKSFLFNESIHDNIVCNSKDYDKERYLEVVKTLKLNKFFDELQYGEHTIIGENGVKLSGGQIQKISIARALIKNPDMIVFDEATSNIDKASKDMFKEVIQDQLRDKLVFIIDHTSEFDDISSKVINLDNL